MNSTLKIINVGDLSSGKTALFVTYKNRKFPFEYVPCWFEIYTCRIPVNDQHVTLRLCDSAGIEDLDDSPKYDYYCGCDICMVCYKINNRNSFDNVKNKWIPEIKRLANNPIVLIIGLHSTSLDDDNDIRVITVDEAQILCQEVGADEFLECDPKHDYESVLNVFQVGIKHALFRYAHKKQKQSCVIM
jgi:Ras family protein A